MKRLKVYISGPITRGSRNWNVFQAFDAQEDLMLRGFAPLNPMASCCYPFAWQENMPHDLWLDVDAPWIAASDAVYRLPGESTGADWECKYATELGVPVFQTVKELETFRDERNSDQRAGREAIEGGGPVRPVATGDAKARGGVFRFWLG